MQSYCLQDTSQDNIIITTEPPRTCDDGIECEHVTCLDIWKVLVAMCICDEWFRISSDLTECAVDTEFCVGS